MAIPSSITSSHTLQLSQQEFFHIRGQRDASYNIWPKGDRWRSNQLICECDDLKIVVEVRLAAAILGKTCCAWKALSIVADAADVAPKFIGKENIGAKVHGLSKALESPTSARQAR